MSPAAARPGAARAVFLDLGHRERRPHPLADRTAPDLPAATAWILSQTLNGGRPA